MFEATFFLGHSNQLKFTLEGDNTFHTGIFKTTPPLGYADFSEAEIHVLCTYFVTHHVILDRVTWLLTASHMTLPVKWCSILSINACCCFSNSFFDVFSWTGYINKINLFILLIIMYWPISLSIFDTFSKLLLNWRSLSYYN